MRAQTDYVTIAKNGNEDYPHVTEGIAIIIREVIKVEADRKLVRRLAELALLGIREEEEMELADDMNVIIGYMKQLAKIDTEGIEPMEHVLPLKNVLRPDTVKNYEEKGELIKCATVVKDGCYVVPNVVNPI